MNLELIQKRIICYRIIKRLLMNETRKKKKPFLKDVRYYTMSMCNSFIVASTSWVKDIHDIYQCIDGLIEIDCDLAGIPRQKYEAGKLKQIMQTNLKNLSK